MVVSWAVIEDSRWLWDRSTLSLCLLSLRLSEVGTSLDILSIHKTLNHTLWSSIILLQHHHFIITPSLQKGIRLHKNLARLTLCNHLRPKPIRKEVVDSRILLVEGEAVMNICSRFVDVEFLQKAIDGRPAVGGDAGAVEPDGNVGEVG